MHKSISTLAVLILLSLPAVSWPAGQPAIFSADYGKKVMNVKYEDDPRLAYWDELTAAVKAATPKDLQGFDPVVVTAETFIKRPEIYDARQLLRAGRLVVVDRSGKYISTDNKGRFIGTVKMPFRTASDALIQALNDKKRADLARFILDHVRVSDELSIADYVAETRMVVGPLKQYPVLKGRFVPVIYERCDYSHRCILVAREKRNDTKPVVTAADLYYLLGGRLSGNVFLVGGNVIGDASLQYNYIGSYKWRDHLIEQIKGGLLSRAGAKAHHLRVKLYKGSPREAITTYYRDMGKPVPGEKSEQ